MNQNGERTRMMLARVIGNVGLHIKAAAIRNMTRWWTV
jgi:hypothetical protein